MFRACPLLHVFHCFHALRPSVVSVMEFQQQSSRHGQLHGFHRRERLTQSDPAVGLGSGSLTTVFQRASVESEVASISFRFPETKSAHLKFSPLSVSDYNL